MTTPKVQQQNHQKKKSKKKNQNILLFLILFFSSFFFSIFIQIQQQKCINILHNTFVYKIPHLFRLLQTNIQKHNESSYWWWRWPFETTTTTNKHQQEQSPVSLIQLTEESSIEQLPRNSNHNELQQQQQQQQQEQRQLVQRQESSLTSFEISSLNRTGKLRSVTYPLRLLDKYDSSNIGMYRITHVETSYEMDGGDGSGDGGVVIDEYIAAIPVRYDGIEHYDMHRINLPIDFVKKNQQQILQGQLYVSIIPAPTSISPDNDELIIPTDSIINVVHDPPVTTSTSVISTRSRDKFDNDENLLFSTGIKTIALIRISTNDSVPIYDAETIVDTMFNPSGINLKTQYEACSFKQLQFQLAPVGLIEIYLNQSVSNYHSGSDIVNAAQEQIALNGVPDKQIPPISDFVTFGDKVIVIAPPGTGTWVANSGVYHWRAQFNNIWSLSLSALMHEIGHTIGLTHSNERGVAYADRSSYMSAAYKNHDWPQKCFSGIQNWQLQWYKTKHRTITIRQLLQRQFLIPLATFVDYDLTTENDVVVLNIANMLYLQYNMAAKFNIDTEEFQNQITITAPDNGGTTNLAGLSIGQKFHIWLTIRTEDIGKIENGSRKTGETTSEVEGDNNVFSDSYLYQIEYADDDKEMKSNGANVQESQQYLVASSFRPELDSDIMMMLVIEACEGLVGQNGAHIIVVSVGDNESICGQTEAPTASPTEVPVSNPTATPTISPTKIPTASPTPAPTATPTDSPTPAPTATPTNKPTEQPTRQPTEQPTNHPTEQPTECPSLIPSSEPSDEPTYSPTTIPSSSPTKLHSVVPTQTPSDTPSDEPTSSPKPSVSPSSAPSIVISITPTDEPSHSPSDAPSKSTIPSLSPSVIPSDLPSEDPTNVYMWEDVDTYGPSAKPTFVRNTVDSLVTHPPTPNEDGLSGETNPPTPHKDGVVGKSVDYGQSMGTSFPYKISATTANIQFTSPSQKPDVDMTLSNAINAVASSQPQNSGTSTSYPTKSPSQKPVEITGNAQLDAALAEAIAVAARSQDQNSATPTKSPIQNYVESTGNDALDAFLSEVIAYADSNPHQDSTTLPTDYPSSQNVDAITGNAVLDAFLSKAIAAEEAKKTEYPTQSPVKAFVITTNDNLAEAIATAEKKTSPDRGLPPPEDASSRTGIKLKKTFLQQMKQNEEGKIDNTSITTTSEDDYYFLKVLDHSSYKAFVKNFKNRNNEETNNDDNDDESTKQREGGVSVNYWKLMNLFKQERTATNSSTGSTARHDFDRFLAADNDNAKQKNLGSDDNTSENLVRE